MKQRVDNDKTPHSCYIVRNRARASRGTGPSLDHTTYQYVGSQPGLFDFTGDGKEEVVEEGYRCDSTAAWRALLEAR